MYKLIFITLFYVLKVMSEICKVKNLKFSNIIVWKWLNEVYVINDNRNEDKPSIAGYK